MVSVIRWLQQLDNITTPHGLLRGVALESCKSFVAANRIYGECGNILRDSMRRLLAILALAASSAAYFSPLVAAAQLSAVPSCCLRSGKHHCHEASGASGGYGFRTTHNSCPYSVPIAVARFQALHAARFSLAVPRNVAVVSGKGPQAGYHVVTHQLSARAPPTCLSN